MLGISSVVLFFPFVITVLTCFLKKHNPKNKYLKSQFIIDAVFIAYCYILIGYLYFPLEIHFLENIPLVIRYNLIPFAYMNTILTEHQDIDMLLSQIKVVIGNFLALVPLGAYLAFYSKKRNLNMILLFAAGFGAETIQLALILLTRNTARIADIDDVILNLSGGLIAYYISSRIMKTKAAAQI